MRAVSGVEADEAGLELGDVRLDAPLAELLHGGEQGGFRPLPTPAGMASDLFPFQERGLGWLRLLGPLAHTPGAPCLNHIPMFTVDVLGIYPDLVSLIPQLVLALAPFAWKAVQRMRRPQTPPTVGV